MKYGSIGLLMLGNERSNSRTGGGSFLYLMTLPETKKEVLKDLQGPYLFKADAMPVIPNKCVLERHQSGELCKIRAHGPYERALE